MAATAQVPNTDGGQLTKETGEAAYGAFCTKPPHTTQTELGVKHGHKNRASGPSRGCFRRPSLLVLFSVVVLRLRLASCFVLGLSRRAPRRLAESAFLFEQNLHGC